jgi:hypothetical protein
MRRAGSCSASVTKDYLGRSFVGHNGKSYTGNIQSIQTQGDCSVSHDVFISFSTKDTETAHRVYDGLAAHGISCWISSKNIPAGSNYQSEIPNILKTAKVMVLIFSRNANSSGEIEKELALASQNRLTVMPLRIDDAHPTNAFTYNLATSQWVEVFPDFERSLNSVAKTIKDVTSRIETFTLKVRKVLEDDGHIGPTEQKFLEEIASESHIVPERARRIISDVVGGSVALDAPESIRKYLEVIYFVLADGKVSNFEREMLARRAKEIGVSPGRADALLLEELEKAGISKPADNSEAVPPATKSGTIVASPITAGSNEILAPMDNANSVSLDQTATSPAPTVIAQLPQTGRPSAKKHLRNLFAVVGEKRSLAEMTANGAYKTDYIKICISDFKNPKYAGGELMFIETDGDFYWRT